MNPEIPYIFPFNNMLYQKEIEIINLKLEKLEKEIKSLNNRLNSLNNIQEKKEQIIDNPTDMYII